MNKPNTNIVSFRNGSQQDVITGSRQQLCRYGNCGLELETCRCRVYLHRGNCGLCIMQQLQNSNSGSHFFSSEARLIQACEGLSPRTALPDPHHTVTRESACGMAQLCTTLPQDCSPCPNIGLLTSHLELTDTVTNVALIIVFSRL